MAGSRYLDDARLRIRFIMKLLQFSNFYIETVMNTMLVEDTADEYIMPAMEYCEYYDIHDDKSKYLQILDLLLCILHRILSIHHSIKY